MDVTAGIPGGTDKKRERRGTLKKLARRAAARTSFSKRGEAYDAALACSTSRCRNTRRNSLPVGVRGSSLTITISRGSL